jgi:putative two-component system response regulator
VSKPARSRRASSTPRGVPARVFVVSVGALLIPLTAYALSPAWLQGGGVVLIWLPALLPAFLLTYHRGWRGGWMASAAGLATLALVEVEGRVLGVPAVRWGHLLILVALLLAVSLGSGVVAQLLLGEREGAAQAALADPLTGLPNRRRAAVFLESAWAAATRGRGLAVVVFDLDHLRPVNEARGHAEGDRALRAFAGILKSRTRRMDLSARFGGEEFISVLVDCDIEHATGFAEEVRARMARTDLPWGRVTVSAGVSALEPGMGSPDVLVAAADRALYAAKENGRDQVCRGDRPPPSPAISPLPTRPEAPRTHLRGVEILLVDDDPDTLRSTARLLQRMECRVTPAISPREALNTLTTNPHINLLVTDIVMPEMSGFTLVEVASRVRPGLPVLYMSGYPSDEVYWGGTPGARSAFLAKPLEAPELQRTLLKLLGAPAAAGGREGQERETWEGHEPAGTKGGELSRAIAGPTGGRRLEGSILIVDNDEAVVHALQRLFRRAGYGEPIGLTDPRRTREVLADHDVDLLILDLMMPEMDGFAVMHQVTSALGSGEYFPILVLTGDDDPGIRQRALAAGAMDFLNKPFDPAEAEARVRNLLQTRFLTHRLARERDSLEERVRERTAELADTRSELLHRLAQAAEYRDDATGRHVERVGLLSAALAAQMGMDAREVDLIRRTAPMHDIGKIGVPDSILHKIGPLTPTEFELMKMHTTIGARILGGSRHRLLTVARDIALCHHERWDGAGYPGGRSGEAIPVHARIVAVADTFDALAHTRPYKEALPPAMALAEVVRCSGTQFDPAVVAALQALSDREGSDIFRLLDPIDPLRDTTGAPEMTRGS